MYLSRFFFLFLISIVLTGCGSDLNEFVATNGSAGLSSETTEPTDSNTSEQIRRIGARVVLPAGMSFASFPGSTVISQLDEAEVGSSGETFISLKEGGRVLAVFLDADGEPILTGILSDDLTEVSVETTVQTSVYVALGTVLLPEEIKQRFWGGVKDFPGYQDLVVNAEAMFLDDRFFFQSVAYRDLIRGYVQELNATETLEINPRLVTDGAVKSGLQIEEVGGDAVVVVNTIRRRAHAFVYKLDFTDKSDARTVLIDESTLALGGPLNSTKDTGVSPPSAVTSTIGALQNVASGKGIEFARKESDMLDLSLGLSEKEANYSIRVIGPSPRTGVLTDAEDAKLTRLNLETLGIDFVMPLIFLAVGQDNYAEKYLPNLKASDQYLAAVQAILTDVVAAEDALKKGDFKTAVVEMFTAAKDQVASNRFKFLLQSFFNLISLTADTVGDGFTVDQGDKIINNTGTFFKALKAVDVILQAADWARITAAYATSNKVEDFRIKVTENKVSLLPPGAAVIQGKAKSIQAVIQDGSTTLGAGEAFEYRWSTTGTYGIIRDSLGKSGTSFTTSRDTVEYVASEGTFPDDAMDEVTVEIVITGPGGTVPVGTADPSILLIRPRGFEIYPENAEMMGGTTLPLRVVLTDGSDPFESVVYDYQMIWETPGNFGLFNGVSRNVTESTTNRVPYEALEEEDEGTESVAVSVYSKLKGETGPFSFEERVTGSIQITNDENKKILYVSNSIITGQNTDSIFINWFVNTVFDIAPVEGAESYQATIIEHNPSPFFIGQTQSFSADDPDDLTGGVYRITTSRNSGSVPKDLEDAAARVSAGVGNAMAFQGSIRGLVKVVVTLRQ